MIISSGKLLMTNKKASYRFNFPRKGSFLKFLKMFSMIKCIDSAGLTHQLSGKISFSGIFDWEKETGNFKGGLQLNISENPNSDAC